jgi:hypothetical protein
MLVCESPYGVVTLTQISRCTRVLPRCGLQKLRVVKETLRAAGIFVEECQQKFMHGAWRQVTERNEEIRTTASGHHCL